MTTSSLHPVIEQHRRRNDAHAKSESVTVNICKRRTALTVAEKRESDLSLSNGYAEHAAKLIDASGRSPYLSERLVMWSEAMSLLEQAYSGTERWCDLNGCCSDADELLRKYEAK
jgi:hypothetical protein